MSAQSALTEGLPDAAYDAEAISETEPGAARVLGLIAVSLGVAALAGGTFVLSYSAIRAVALQAGITPHLARGYPLLLDAMLVIVLAAVLALRGAGLPSRLLAWLTLLLVLAASAGADALHAAGHRLPHQAAVITAAILPWVLVLFAFMLMLAMLRHARLRRASDDGVRSSAAYLSAGYPAQSDYGPPTLDLPVRNSSCVAPSLATVQLARTPDQAEAGHEPGAASDGSGAAGDDTSTAGTGTAGDDTSTASEQLGSANVGPGAALAMDDVAAGDAVAADDPASDEATSEPADGDAPYPADALAQSYSEPADESAPEPTGESAPEPDGTEDADGDGNHTDGTAAELGQDPPGGPDDGDMPVFHRMFSAPTPPTADPAPPTTDPAPPTADPAPTEN